MYDGREEEEGAAKAKPPPTPPTRADIDDRVCAGMSAICVASTTIILCVGARATG